METTKNTTVKEREFIAAVEAHRNAEGKVIAWDIYANGNGKVIFENATKDRYSCACVVMMSDGSMYLHFDGSLSHPYDRKTYRRKGNALKGFGMQEGRNESKQPATSSGTPRISTETAETVNVSVEGEEEDKPRKIDQIKIRRVYGDMFCVSMYVDGKLVDCENGITESQKDKIQNLFDNGKLFASIQPPQSPETPQTAECIGDPKKLAQTA